MAFFLLQTMIQTPLVQRELRGRHYHPRSSTWHKGQEMLILPLYISQKPPSTCPELLKPSNFYQTILQYSINRCSGRSSTNPKACITYNLIKTHYSLMFLWTSYLPTTKKCHHRLAILSAMPMPLIKQILSTSLQ